MYANIPTSGILLDTNLINSKPKLLISKKALKKAYDEIITPFSFGVTHQAKSDTLMSSLGLDKVGTVDKVSFNGNKIKIDEISINDDKVYTELKAGNIGNLSANILIKKFKKGNTDNDTIVVKELSILSMDLVTYGACPNCRVDIAQDAGVMTAGLEHNATLYKKIKLNSMEENNMVDNIQTEASKEDIMVTLAKADEIKKAAEAEVETRDKLVKELEAKAIAQNVKIDQLTKKLADSQEAFIELETKLDSDLNGKLKESIIAAQREAKAEYIKELDAVAIVDKAISEGKIKPAGRELFISLAKSMDEDFEKLLKSIDPAIDFTRLSKHVSPDVLTDIIKEGHESQVSLNAEKDMANKYFGELYPESKLNGDE
jgi:hypothetical protein